MYGGLCGFIPCGRPKRGPDSLTCDDQAHTDWHAAYANRFGRLSYPSVRRVIRTRREEDRHPDGNNPGPAHEPAVRNRLPELDGIPGVVMCAAWPQADKPSQTKPVQAGPSQAYEVGLRSACGSA